MYDLEPLERIFTNLIAQGGQGKAAAKEIVAEYLKNGDADVVNLYKKVVAI